MQFLEKHLTQRLFKINHVLLSNQAVSVLFYHLVLVFEYVQLLFFIFYKVPISNEYSLIISSNQTNNNTTNSNNLTNSNAVEQ